ncbi:LTA synthase family protein [Ulvibacter antarcticus]|uniref:LTA synthase family protein n=1 Tax=Ulvibacter antarcticus TaxID=442714 RepID=UPI0029390370|nr:LTA synthase family protein [Ulvibacter antarcticus]
MLGNTFVIGFLFDLGTVSFFALPYALYLLIFPQKWYGSFVDKVITYFAYSLGLIIFLFSFFAEFTFWEEFQRRFNFIAVDYLIYTYEVVNNIHESYPIPLLVGAILLLLAGLLFLTIKKEVFKATFNGNSTFKQKILPVLIFGIITVIFALFVENKDAEFSENRYNNELAKSGIYSFFAAFRNNELSYTEFYNSIDASEAFDQVNSKFTSEGDLLKNTSDHSIFRTVNTGDTLQKKTPNVIFICIESLSADFLGSFGNEHKLTPNLDSLSNESLFFTNLFATGTRTVRGMEAITLSIPPTPGRSIVKRENNGSLFTIGEIFKQMGYQRNFFYGGDGYFDNMNTFFGGNGFDIVDRGRGFLLDANVKTQRTNIEDEEVTFENAWGVADVDIYNKVIKEADKAHANGQPFFDFVMTTSNHRPYTYPEGTVEIPSGSNRHGAVQYTDFAIGEFLDKARLKPWFENTVFVIMADHCASSAGKQELDIKNYHIPALIYNSGLPSEKISKMSSQIDMFPTLFSLLHWKYDSNLFGRDILSMQPSEERAFIGNYRKLGLLKGDQLMVLGDQKKSNFYRWDKATNELITQEADSNYLQETISYYQVADYLFSNGGLKLKTLGLDN